MSTHRQSRGRTRKAWLTIASVLAVVAAGVAVGAPAQASEAASKPAASPAVTPAVTPAVRPAAAPAASPSGATVTVNCDESRPGYGTNSAGGFVTVNIGSSVNILFDGGNCRGFMLGGDTSLFSVPGMPMQCCTAIPSGTVYTATAVRYSNLRSGFWQQPGEFDIRAFNNRYALIEQINLLVADPNVPATPDAPTITEVEPFESEAHVYFDAPKNDGGCPILRYEYRIASPNPGAWESEPPRSSSVSFTGLKGGTTYRAEIRAVNKFGASQPAIVTFKTKNLPPSPPTDLVFDNGMDNTTITFTPGQSGGAPIVKYQYQLEWEGKPWVDFKPGPATIDDLDAFAFYTVRIRAINGDGEVSVPTDWHWFSTGAETDLVICHWNGRGFERWDVTDVDAMDEDYGEHAYHKRDIVPQNYFGSRNWDAKGSAIWENGCKAAAPIDTDKDGTIDLVDTDDDNDGSPDVVDCDDDNDGVPDIQDEDFDDRSDSDGDGVSNALESDDDNDGIEDGVDTDSDGDGAPDATQCALGGPRDSDADGILDYFEGDKDGDCVPDVRDRDGFEMFEPGACRFKSIPPRPRDRDRDGTRDSRDRDMDGDGIPNAKDPDVDGDLVPDARDGDANGDGIVETQDQALATPFTVPALKAGKPTMIPRSALRTVTGQTAEVAVDCKARIVNRSKGAIAPTGDIAAPTTKGLCDVVTNGDGVQITVVGDQPTRVTIKITAPATGEYKAFRQVEQVIVR